MDKTTPKIFMHIGNVPERLLYSTTVPVKVKSIFNNLRFY